MTTRRRLSVLFVALVSLSAPCARAQQPAGEDTEFNELLSMDIADLTVTSVSKRPQRLEDAAAAVTVITQEDLHRAGITSIPDALRMVPGVDVAQINAHSWAISIRGFNGELSNKLLVLIDGRSVYTPVFGGTYWDDQFVPIEEIDHIEVVRGPGGSTWGANAMNGVINIITKHASSLQGNAVSENLGTDGLNDTVLQHGGKIADGTFYRGYASYLHRGNLDTPAGTDNYDGFSRERAGFRLDADRQDGNSFMFSGSAYNGDDNQHEDVYERTPPNFLHHDNDDNENYGGYLLARWDHQFSAKSDGTLQASVDHYARLSELTNQRITTFDLDWQHNIQTSERNHFSWGLGFRDVYSDITPTFELRVGDNGQEELNRFSAFVQDDYSLVPNKLLLTLGSKFEHDYFSGYDVQPTARLSYLISDSQTLWAAVSHAVRTPSIVEDEMNVILSVTPGPTYGEVQGNSNLNPEELTAYEVGYRNQITPKLEIDTTAYLNEYRNLFTFQQQTPFTIDAGLTTVVPYQEENLGHGHVFGAEASATYKVTPDWKLMGAYSFGRSILNVDPSSTTNLESTEAQMPRHEASVRSYWNITPRLQWDNMLYYVDGVGAPTDAYVRYDTRLGWHVTPNVELSVIGQNLLEPKHVEFPAQFPETVNSEIDRALIGRVAIRF